MCPRLWSSVFQGRLHSSGRHLYPVKPPFGSTWRWLFDGPENDRRSFHVAAPVVWNTLPLSISAQHPSVEDIKELRTPIFYEYTRVVLTYLLRSEPKNEMSGRERERSGNGVVSGVTEKRVSAERKFPPLPLRSHSLPMNAL